MAKHQTFSRRQLTFADLAAMPQAALPPAPKEAISPLMLLQRRAQLPDAFALAGVDRLKDEILERLRNPEREANPPMKQFIEEQARKDKASFLAAIGDALAHIEGALPATRQMAELAGFLGHTLNWGCILANKRIAPGVRYPRGPENASLADRGAAYDEYVTLLSEAAHRLAPRQYITTDPYEDASRYQCKLFPSNHPLLEVADALRAALLLQALVPNIDEKLEYPLKVSTAYGFEKLVFTNHLLRSWLEKHPG